MAHGFVVGRGGDAVRGRVGRRRRRRGLFPGEEVGVEGAIGLPDSEHEMEQLAHAMAQRHVAARPLGPEAAIQRSDRRVVDDGTACGVPQVMACQVVAFAGHAQRARRQWVAVLVHAGAVFLGKNAEVADQLLRRGEAVDVHDLGHQNRGRGRADAGDREHLNVRPGREGREGVGEQVTQVVLGLLRVTDLGHEVADQCLGDVATQRADGMARGQLHLFD